MKIIGKIIEWIVFILLIVILFLVASPLLPTKTYISTYAVSTGSMEPTIQTGSVVFSTNNDSNIQVNDIIAFQSPIDKDTTVVHRVVDIQDGSYITKGDNNNSQDAWVVNQDLIKGKVIYTIPYIGYVIEWIKTPIGFAIALGIPALILCIGQIRKIKEGINDEVDKRTQEEVSRRISQQ